MNHLPYHLELLHLRELDKISSSGEESQSCLVVAKNVHYHKFNKRSMIQITVCDRTVSDFSVLCWGDCGRWTTKVRCGSVLIVENFWRDNGRKYQTIYPTGRTNERTQVHVVSINLNASPLNPEVFPNLSRRVAEFTAWASQQDYLKLGSITTECRNLKEALGQSLFDIDLIFSPAEMRKHSSHIQCTDIDGNIVLLKVLEQEQLTALDAHVIATDDKLTSSSCRRITVRLRELCREVFAGHIAFLYTTPTSSFSLVKVQNTQQNVDLAVDVGLARDISWEDLFLLLQDPCAAAKFRGIRMSTKCTLMGVILPVEDSANLRGLLTCKSNNTICGEKRRRATKEFFYKPVLLEIGCNKSTSLCLDDRSNDDRIITAVIENEAFENILGISAQKLAASLKIGKKQCEERQFKDYAGIVADVISRLTQTHRTPGGESSNKCEIVLKYYVEVEVDENEICLLPAAVFVENFSFAY